jgi:hypothetical protein
MEWAQGALNRVDRGAFHREFEHRNAIQYFYEPFLHAFDPQLRRELGVWYTPPEIVRYQVAKVHRLLIDELELPGGLANEKVTVLDPAVGTGSYLLEVVRVIHDELTKATGTAALAPASVGEALTRRIFGFELLPAPFVVAHLQLMLYLRELGAQVGDEERVGVFLTNALTGWAREDEPKVPLWDETFEEERELADHVKHNEPILVVIGNPPYARYAAAAVDEERDLIGFYKGRVDGEGNLHRPSLLYQLWGGASRSRLSTTCTSVFFAWRSVGFKPAAWVSFPSSRTPAGSPERPTHHARELASQLRSSLDRRPARWGAFRGVPAGRGGRRERFHLWGVLWDLGLRCDRDTGKVREEYC